MGFNHPQKGQNLTDLTAPGEQGCTDRDGFAVWGEGAGSTSRYRYRGIFSELFAEFWFTYPSVP